MLSEIIYYIEIECLSLFLLIIFILIYFLRKNTNPVVFLLALITWFLNSFIIILLTYDIYLSNIEKQSIKVNNLKNLISKLYLTIYWTIFICSWILIPLITKYEECGYFTRKEKLIYSIKANLLFYGILLLIGIALFALAYYKLSEETKTYFMKNCFNFSYLYGFFFLILLLGYSIPKLPKNIYDKIFYKKIIKSLEDNAKNLKNKLEEVNKDLTDNYYKLEYIDDKIKINKDLKENSNIEKLENKIKDKQTEETKFEKYEKFLNKKIKYIKNNETVFKIKIKKINVENMEEIDIKDIHKKIAELNIKLKQDEWDNLRLQCQLQSTYNDWTFLKTIVKKGRKYKSSIIDQELTESRLSLMGIDEFIPIKNISTIKIIYYMKIHPIFLLFFVILFSILGLIIILSEICIILPLKTSIFHILNNMITNVFYIHIFIIISVFVFLFMSFYALLNFKLTKNYRVYGPRQTDGVSMLYFTNNFSKIIFPLALNIIIMINHGNDATKQTCLEKDFGINIKNHIFVFISKYYPLVLVVFVFLNLCGFFSKLIDCFSIETITGIFSDKSKENKDEGYEYLMEINKKNKGKLLSGSIMDEIIEE